MNRNILSAAVLLFLSVCLAALQACKPAETTIPINVQYASEVGSLHFEIIYEADNYKAIRVDKGDSFADSLLEYDTSNPGHIIVGIVSGEGMSGDGTIATVVLQATKNADSGITLENVIAYDMAATFELPVKVSVKEGGGESPTTAIIEFLPTEE